MRLMATVGQRATVLGRGRRARAHVQGCENMVWMHGGHTGTRGQDFEESGPDPPEQVT